MEFYLQQIADVALGGIVNDVLVVAARRADASVSRTTTRHNHAIPVGN